VHVNPVCEQIATCLIRNPHHNGGDICSAFTDFILMHGPDRDRKKEFFVVRLFAKDSHATKVASFALFHLFRSKPKGSIDAIQKRESSLSQTEVAHSRSLIHRSVQHLPVLRSHKKKATRSPVSTCLIINLWNSTCIKICIDENKIVWNWYTGIHS
jgi:hypothetical protein